MRAGAGGQRRGVRVTAVRRRGDWGRRASRDETAWCCDETAERGEACCVCLSVLRARAVCACPCFVRSVVCVVWCVF